MAIIAFYCSGMCLIGSAFAQVAQLVEQWTENPRVGGSNPPLGTTYYNLSSSHSVSVSCFQK